METDEPGTQQTESEHSRPCIIGLYGVSGCGKSHLLNRLRSHLPAHQYAFFEGAEVVALHSPVGLSGFSKLSPEHRERIRQKAILAIATQCRKEGKTGIVTGHAVLWDGNEHAAWSRTKGTPEVILTQADMETYSHIIYLQPLPDLVYGRRLQDRRAQRRDRPMLITPAIAEWQHWEYRLLSRLCKQHAIHYSRIIVDDNLELALSAMQTPPLDKPPSIDNVAYRLDDEDMESRMKTLDGVLVFDGDRTLTPSDTGTLFWTKLRGRPTIVKGIFEKAGYTYGAFCALQAAYEAHAERVEFEWACQEVAREISLYPKLKQFLIKVSKHKSFAAIVITCGLKQIWKQVIREAGLEDTVHVVGNTVYPKVEKQSTIVTPATKAAFVKDLQDSYGQYVVAFGDSPVDLPMLIQADRAIVVVGDERTRSKTMDDELSIAIDRGLDASQLLIPTNSKPRLDIQKLPLITLDELYPNQKAKWGLNFTHFSDERPTQILATATRDAQVPALQLREAHRKIGAYLAMRYLSNEIGIEPYEIEHCTGGTTSGFRIKNEEQTLIVPLMRAGEPMAQGVNDFLPRAIYVHAKSPQDVTPNHLKDCKRVILVDAVINSGRSILEFVDHIRGINTKLPILAVAGVVQHKFVQPGGDLDLASATYGNIKVCGLRVSHNQYKGKGATDTGHRLFNTRFLDS